MKFRAPTRGAKLLCGTLPAGLGSSPRSFVADGGLFFKILPRRRLRPISSARRASRTNPCGYCACAIPGGFPAGSSPAAERFRDTRIIADALVRWTWPLGPFDDPPQPNRHHSPAIAGHVYVHLSKIRRRRSRPFYTLQNQCAGVPPDAAKAPKPKPGA